MRIGIVGSRRYTNRKVVEDLVASLPKNSVIISGGCRGVDTWAVEKAKELGYDYKEHIPILKGCSYRWEFTQAYYERNKLIVDDSDVIYAFVMDDRKGGTENTIKHAIQSNKKVIIGGLESDKIQAEIE